MLIGKKTNAPKNVDPKKWRQIYEKEVDYKSLVKQKKTLEYIINE